MAASDVTPSTDLEAQLADANGKLADVSAQLAEGAESLGRERALWMADFARMKALVDVACTFIDEGKCWTTLADAVATYRASQ